MWRDLNYIFTHARSQENYTVHTFSRSNWAMCFPQRKKKPREMPSSRNRSIKKSPRDRKGKRQVNSWA